MPLKNYILAHNEHFILDTLCPTQFRYFKKEITWCITAHLRENRYISQFFSGEHLPLWDVGCVFQSEIRPKKHDLSLISLKYAYVELYSMYKYEPSEHKICNIVRAFLKMYVKAPVQELYLACPLNGICSYISLCDEASCSKREKTGGTASDLSQAI